ncbi:MAG: lysophospholipid acyltransferase family protein [Gemmatimonadaceae bacterium]
MSKGPSNGKSGRATVAHRLQYGALRMVLAVLGVLPFQWARRMGEALGMLGYRPFGIRRRVVTRQIAAAFPGLAEREVADLARGAYRSLGRTTIESALSADRGRDGVLALVGSNDPLTPITEALAAGRGVVLVTGHLGNWELSAAWLAAKGVPIDVITRRQANPLFDDWITRTRQALGLLVVPDAEAVRRVPRAFREGRAVGFVADQGVLGLASTFVPFFGRPAKTPRGPAVFALKYALPMIFVVAVLQPEGRYHVVIEPIPLRPSGDRERDVDDAVAMFTKVLERYVRRYPEQYFWHHRRWRRQPPDTPEELREPR